MLRTLRARLVLSHILPLLVVVPVMYAALAYLLDTRFLVPKLTEELLDNARLVTEVTQAGYLLYGEPDDIRQVLVRLNINPKIRMHFLQADGALLFSNDPIAQPRVGQRLDVPGLSRLQHGEEVILTSYSFLPGGRDSIEVLLPVVVLDNQLIGILWMTYYEASLDRLFQEFRLISWGVMLASLLAGALIGSLLALNIGSPLRQVTQAIYSLARGERSETLIEMGPEEVRELSRAVNALVERLFSLEQARRQLLANLTHELGRPLGALRSAIQALGRGAAQDPQLLYDLTPGMDQETARLQNVLNELAHLHDQVLGPLELERQPLDLGEWLTRLLLPYEQLALAKRLLWHTEIPDVLPEILADPNRLAQVVGNLASNAVKYTPPGGEVNISAGQQDQQVWIRVQDTGPGIAPDEQEKIFQPFYRGTTGKRIKQGMGLGLSIARDLAVAHGGRLALESRPGGGSTFTLWLPIN